MKRYKRQALYKGSISFEHVKYCYWSTPKDRMRIEKIADVAKVDINKAQRLARTQANRITDIEKMVQRAYVSIKILGENHPVTLEFIKGLDRLIPNNDFAKYFRYFKMRNL